MRQLVIHGYVSLLVHRYVGLKRNEIADELAGNGAEKTSASLEPIIKVTHQHYKTWIRGNVF